MTAAPKRKTREQLGDEILNLRAALEASRSECKRIDDRNGQLRADLDDLKERFANAEADNQRMRGYIARVQEDDVVREELVIVGEPGGEEQKVPKRIPTQFPVPDPYTIDLPRDGYGLGPAYAELARGDKTKRRHWVTYGGQR